VTRIDKVKPGNNMNLPQFMAVFIPLLEKHNAKLFSDKYEEFVPYEKQEEAT
jgi:hypothetical protein